MAVLDYTATATITADTKLASLASGMAWCTTAIANTNNYLDAHLYFKTKSDASATVGATIELYLLRGSLSGAEASASASVSATQLRNGALIGVVALGMTATGSATSIIGPLSVAEAAGGYLPQTWVVGVANTNSGVALAASADQHLLIYQGIKIA